MYLGYPKLQLSRTYERLSVWTLSSFCPHVRRYKYIFHAALISEKMSLWSIRKTITFRSVLQSVPLAIEIVFKWLCVLICENFSTSRRLWCLFSVNLCLRTNFFIWGHVVKECINSMEVLCIEFISVYEDIQNVHDYYSISDSEEHEWGVKLKRGSKVWLY